MKSPELFLRPVRSSLLVAVASINCSVWCSHVAAQDIFIGHAIPVLAAAPANGNHANISADRRAAAEANRLRNTLVLPVAFPNPLAFTVHWVVIDRTSVEYRRAQAMAIHERALALRKAALARRAPQNAAVQNAVQQQMRRVLEPMLRSELSFACRAAGANDDERRTLISESKKWFDTFLVDFTKNQDPNQQRMLLQGVRGVWIGGPQQKIEDPSERIAAGVGTIVAATLPQKKASAYKSECRKREEFERQTTVDNVVERIDEQAKLSPEQWKKISQSLNDYYHWHKNQTPQLAVFTISNSMWPGVPNERVLPELSPAQKTVVERLNRSNEGHVFFGGGAFGMMGGAGEVIDDIDLNTDQPPGQTTR